MSRNYYRESGQDQVSYSRNSYSNNQSLGSISSASVRKRKIRVPITTLSKCELLLLHILVKGRLSKEAASELGKDLKTIETQRKSIMDKLNCKSAVQLGYKTAKEGLV